LKEADISLTLNQWTELANGVAWKHLI